MDRSGDTADVTSQTRARLPKHEEGEPFEEARCNAGDIRRRLPPLRFIADWSKPKTSSFIRFVPTSRPTIPTSFAVSWTAILEAVTSLPI